MKCHNEIHYYVYSVSTNNYDIECQICLNGMQLRIVVPCVCDAKAQAAEPGGLPN